MTDNNQENINVLFIVPSLRRAGAETQLIDLANGLDRRRFKKTLVAFERNVDQIARVDVSEISFHHHPRRNRFDLSVAREIARLIDDRRIDLIHCTMQISLFFAWMATHYSKRKPKMVVAIHTTINVSIKAELYDRLLYRWLIAGCDRVIFVCNAQAEYWKANFSFLSNIATVIYNGVDPDYFDRKPFEKQRLELRRRLDIPDQASVIACIAGFRPEKGHDILLNAFSRLGPMPYLVLAGTGPLQNESEKLCRQLMIDDRVIFLGDVTDVRPLLAASDVTVLASAVETFSIAMLESMAMGVPTFVTDIGGLREAVIPGDTGDLVEAGNSAQLAETLEQYIYDKQRLNVMGERARHRIRDLFCNDKMIKLTASLFSHICQERRTKAFRLAK